jgi:hypothetical protein
LGYRDIHGSEEAGRSDLPERLGVGSSFLERRKKMNDVKEYAEVIAAEIRNAEAGLYDGEPCEEAVLRFLDDCLDIKALVAFSVHGARTTEAVEILRSYGGPTCWISVQDEERVRVAVYSGSDVAELYVSAPSLAAVAFEAADYILEEAQP